MSTNRFIIGRGRFVTSSLSDLLRDGERWVVMNRVPSLVRRSTLLLAAMAFYAGAIGRLAAQPTPPTVREKLPIQATELASFINPIIEAQLEKEHIPGAVFVLVQNGRILYLRGYGFADLENRKRVNPFTTIWRIGSISKVFTATATVQLADRGRFRLTDDVNQYLTRFKVPSTFAEPVRFWNLLTHTAGFDEIRPGTRADTEAGLLSLGDFLAPKLVRLRPPGRLISYSTYGISLAGYLIEQVSGDDFEKYLLQNIWAPLGMRHTNIVVPAKLKADVAKGYELENGRNQLANWEWYHSTPASSINSTAVDMAQFIIALLQHGRYERTRILSESAARDLLRQHFTSHPQLAGFAYGFYEDFTNGEHIFEHGGNVEGFSAQLTLLPDRGMGFFVASQHEPAELKDVVRRALLDHYFPDQRKRIPPTPMAGYRERAARYAGTYEVNEFCHTCGSDRRVYPRIEVKSFPDGTISITGIEPHFVEVSPLFFRKVNGAPDGIVFHQHESGKIDVVAGDNFRVFERIK
ncbi:MAG TPA: serine hydrolase domain-containing protein [Gemmatimonadaceae bacterium]|nr:serine hydrolase domain-containing protein [Gemmatimonadaceae bacterium]